MRIPDRFLEHRVNVRPILEFPQPDGDEYGRERKGVHAIVVDRAKLVVDMRKDSETNGQQILASTRIVMQPEDYLQPGSLVTVWPGRPMERTLQVVATGYAEHSIAPESSQAFLV